jgi:hypothetical protein
MTVKVHDRRAELSAIQAGHAVAAVVQDPFSPNDHITVLRFTRDDPLAGMLARSQIDQAQFSAGRQWQEHWENAGVGIIKAIDPTKEPVDGKGSVVDPFTDRQKEAFTELHVVQRTLGYEGDLLVRDVLGERLPIMEAARRRGRSPRYVGVRFRECLETLARMWNFVG